MSSPNNVHLVLTYKNFFNRSHVGLGVCALNIAKILTNHGITCTVLPVTTINDIRIFITKMEASSTPVTNCNISALWVATPDLQQLLFDFPNVHFSVNCHSNVGFLQTDPKGMKLFREDLDLEKANLNFQVAGNSKKFCNWASSAYQRPILYLPNMYYLDYTVKPYKPVYNGGVLKLSCFGAARGQKNIMSAAAAALQLHEELKVDTEFWVSTGRNDGNALSGILNAIKEMVGNIPGFTLKFNSWASWPEFTNLVRKMHLCMQVSYTESFNICTCDAIANGVPVVVSEAIDWAPNYWVAECDDVNDISRVGRQLLFDPQAPYDGLIALETHNAHSFRTWIDWLGLDNSLMYKSQTVTSSIHLR